VGPGNPDPRILQQSRLDCADLHSRELGLHFKWTIEDTMLRRQLRSVHPPEPAVLMNSADARKLEGLRTDCGCRAGGPAVCLALVLYAFWA
jgi:hypothetical protein